jgi:hypothetical protein
MDRRVGFVMAFIRKKTGPEDSEQSIKITLNGKNVMLEVRNLNPERAANILFAAMMTIINADGSDDSTEDVAQILKTIGGYKDAQ